MYLQTYVYVCFANIVSTCLMSTCLFYLIMNNYNNICYFCYKQFSKYLYFNYSYAYWVGKRRVPRSFFNHYYIYYILIADFRKCCMHNCIICCLSISHCVGICSNEICLSCYLSTYLKDKVFSFP